MRSKLRLNLDQLSVDSFDTSATVQEKGTVFGEQCTCYTNCTCPGCPTCDHTACGQQSCDGSCNTCGDSCYGTCAGQDTCDFTCYDSCRPRLCGSAYMTNCGGVICY